MEILYGFEADYLPPISYPDYTFYEEHNPDYLIGSVHYVFNHKKFHIFMWSNLVIFSKLYGSEILDNV
jgi:histidinol phosphatase-like PHP family hydrolase